MLEELKKKDSEHDPYRPVSLRISRCIYTFPYIIYFALVLLKRKAEYLTKFNVLRNANKGNVFSSFEASFREAQRSSISYVCLYTFSSSNRTEFLMRVEGNDALPPRLLIPLHASPCRTTQWNRRLSPLSATITSDTFAFTISQCHSHNATLPSHNDANGQLWQAHCHPHRFQQRQQLTRSMSALITLHHFDTSEARADNATRRMTLMMRTSAGGFCKLHNG